MKSLLGLKEKKLAVVILKINLKSFWNIWATTK